MRSIDDMLPAVWQDYLMTPARIDYLFLATVLGGHRAVPRVRRAAVDRGGRRRRRAQGPAGTDVRGARTLRRGAVVRAAVPGFSLLYEVFPPLHGIRAVSRFGYLGTVAVAVLGGFGLAATGRSARRPGLAAFAVVAVTTLVALESLAAPIRYLYDPGVPAIYHRLDARPDAVVADLPLASYEDVFANAPAMLNSTASFYRLLNGFSGFTPPSYVEHHDALAGFPDAASVAALRRFGVTHVFVHTDMYGEGQLAHLRESSGLRMMAKESVGRAVPGSRAAGAPLRPLPDSLRQAEASAFAWSSATTCGPQEGVHFWGGRIGVVW